jgi:fructokinase
LALRAGPRLRRSRDHRGAPSRPPGTLEAAGAAEALAAIERYEDRLARGLASIINVLDSDTIMLSGSMSRIARLYETVPRIWGRYVFSDTVSTLLRPAAHGVSSGVRGAAWLGRDHGGEAGSAEGVDREQRGRRPSRIRSATP